MTDTWPCGTSRRVPDENSPSRVGCSYCYLKKLGPSIILVEDRLVEEAEAKLESSALVLDHTMK